MVYLYKRHTDFKLIEFKMGTAPRDNSKNNNTATKPKHTHVIRKFVVTQNF